ncbi:LPS export ABC transporter periplasmic protein LptC [Bdellovibrio bacteriovorus]|uniref:LPS export ABC transporter periplasmic protein LptC n=1 Tax=Bdellovibrio bacteriovorus TaxID=959 RepID=A0A162FT95_BDEBC|nr:LPS export ABC transporter periplasmic protein LptC [Bdellovibrio bacteriovorus]KYG61354.1 LPS export ABC transporter periplasmic protein LptC [Bdellovibrio bacteriovorus]
MAKFKNLIFAALLIILFVEILIIFPNRLEHEDEAEVRKRVEAQEQLAKERDEAIKRGEKPPEQPSSLMEQKMQGVHLVESQQGTRDWELFAVSAEGSQTEGTWKLRQVRVLFYNKEKVEFTVTGDTGTINDKTKDLSVEGNVVTRSENGYIFKTPSIYYSSKTRQIDSPEEVVMQGPADNSGGGMNLKGHRMKVLVDQSKMLIQDRVSAEKPLKDGKKFDIVADGAEFSGKHNEAKFFGKVRMNYDNMKLEGPAASFLYDRASNFLGSVAVTGGVRVSDVDKFATSESVNLDLLADKYTFKGRPKVIQNNDELTGEEIIFLEGGKKVKVERVRARVENKEQ